MAVETILPEALVTLEEAKVYLERTADTTDDEVITRMINYVTGQAELYTDRKLKSRTYDGTTWPYLYVNGEDAGEFDAAEWPLTTLSALVELDTDGVVYRTLDISGVRLDGSGLIYLPNDALVAGTLNHRVAGVAGILPGTAQWKAITGAALRWIEVLFQDHKNHFGRAATISVGNQSITPFDTAMPKDVQRVFEAFRRIL